MDIFKICPPDKVQLWNLNVLYPGGIYPIAGHHDVAKMSQKELIRKPQDSILEKQFLWYLLCILLIHMDAGVLHRTIPYCTKTLLEEAADAEDMAELFIAKAAMGCPWDSFATAIEWWWNDWCASILLPFERSPDFIAFTVNCSYLQLLNVIYIVCFMSSGLHLIARISPEDWCVCGLTCNTITVYISISILSTWNLQQCFWANHEISSLA